MEQDEAIAQIKEDILSGLQFRHLVEAIDVHESKNYYSEMKIRWEDKDWSKKLFRLPLQEDFIVLTYLCLLGREPTKEAFQSAYYHIVTSQRTRYDFIFDIIESEEFKSRKINLDTKQLRKSYRRFNLIKKIKPLLLLRNLKDYVLNYESFKNRMEYKTSQLIEKYHEFSIVVLGELEKNYKKASE